jgi:hypothetical protein
VLGQNLCTINPDGSDRRVLTSTPGTFKPAWAADDNRIAFHYLAPGGTAGCGVPKLRSACKSTHS